MRQTLDKGILDALDTVQVRELAKRARAVLEAEGPLTIGGVVAHTPVQAGLEELVGFLRIAHSVGAASLERRESVSFCERDGTRMSATVPAYYSAPTSFRNHSMSLSYSVAPA